MKFLLILIGLLIPVLSHSEGSWSYLNRTYYPTSDFAGYYYDYCLPYLYAHGYTNNVNVITNTNIYVNVARDMYFQCDTNVIYFHAEKFMGMYVYVNGQIKTIINLDYKRSPYFYKGMYIKP